MKAITFYWKDDVRGPRLVLTDGSIIFQSAVLADQSTKTETIWRHCLQDRFNRHTSGSTQLDGVYKLSDNLFQVAG